MEFTKADENDFDVVYSMMIRARDKLYSEKIFQWNEKYPNAAMILNDIKSRNTFLVKNEAKVIAFFTANSICEDNVHNHIKWQCNDDNWIILHRLCIDPQYQNIGLGQEILKAFELHVEQLGFKSIRIDVFSTNTAAIHIYENFLYMRVGEAICERGLFYIYEKLL